MASVPRLDRVVLYFAFQFPLPVCDYTFVLICAYLFQCFTTEMHSLDRLTVATKASALAATARDAASDDGVTELRVGMHFQRIHPKLKMNFLKRVLDG